MEILCIGLSPCDNKRLLAFKLTISFKLSCCCFACGAVFESFLYIIGNGALEWGPVKQIMRKSVVDPNRTTNTTIRRVGLEGRIEAEEEAA